MSIALALIISAVLHAVAMIGPGWGLPEDDEADSPRPLDAVLTAPRPRLAAPSKARQRPKAHADRPRPSPAQTMTPAAQVAPVAFAEPAAEPALQTAETPAIAEATSAPMGTSAKNSAVESSPGSFPAATTPSPVSIALPGKGRVRYAITRGTGGFVIGQAIYTWEQDGLNYKMQSVTETTGLVALFKQARVVQTSQGEVTADGLRPSEFRNQRTSGVDTASFDWVRHVVSYEGHEERVAEDTQDMLSMYCQLVLLVPKGGHLEMPIATGRKLERYHFERIGEDSVLLAERHYQAIHLKTRSGNDIIEVWIAPDIHGLPLKIRFIDRHGEIFDQQAQDIEVSAMP